MYEVRVQQNEMGVGFGSYVYPAFTSFTQTTRNQETRGDTPPGSTAYLAQRAGRGDCADNGLWGTGNARCDFMYTPDGNAGHVYPPAMTGLTRTCDFSQTGPTWPRAYIGWNAEPRSTMGYFLRVDHAPNSWFPNEVCTGGAGSIGQSDPWDRCVDGTTHLSLTVGPIEPNRQYRVWGATLNREGLWQQGTSPLYFQCP